MADTKRQTDRWSRAEYSETPQSIFKYAGVSLELPGETHSEGTCVNTV